ncbi:hypothetical protein SLT67_29005, partial [Paenibacillus illinoisensis]|uniref:hypothetical protein n=1 Tax=Paenibacillus illinoisensis TaxID=59845 RepID=UPI003CED4219
PSSADGTWTEGSWESRTLPSKEPLPKKLGGGFYFVYKAVLSECKRHQKVTVLLQNISRKSV